jgi:hypothetical protein
MTDSPAVIPRYAGTPWEVGRAAGRTIGPRFGALIERYIRERPQWPGALDSDLLHTNALPWLRVLPERFQDELEGLAEGADLPLQLVAEWQYVESCVRDGCSGFVGRIGGHAWIARNNDTFVPDLWGHAVVKAITDRIPAMSFGLEGDVFTPTGLNARRLWMHHQQLVTADAPRPGRPHLHGWILLTELLETCATIAEVEARLAEVDRDEGMILFVVDGKTDEFAVFECGSTSHVRRTDRPWLAATNHACRLGGGSLGPEDADSLARQMRLETMATDLLDRPVVPRLPGDLIAMVADERVERRGQTFATAYSVVACPALGELWFTFGGVPAASRGNWRPIAWPW